MRLMIIVSVTLIDFECNINLIPDWFKLLECTIYIKVSVVLGHPWKLGFTNLFFKYWLWKWWWVLCHVIKRSLPKTCILSLERWNIWNRFIEVFYTLILGWNNLFIRIISLMMLLIVEQKSSRQEVILVHKGF